MAKIQGRRREIKRKLLVASCEVIFPAWILSFLQFRELVKTSFPSSKLLVSLDFMEALQSKQKITTCRALSMPFAHRNGRLGPTGDHLAGATGPQPAAGTRRASRLPCPGGSNIEPVGTGGTWWTQRSWPWPSASGLPKSRASLGTALGSKLGKRAKACAWPKPWAHENEPHRPHRRSSNVDVGLKKLQTPTIFG